MSLGKYINKNIFSHHCISFDRGKKELFFNTWFKLELVENGSKPLIRRESNTTIEEVENVEVVCIGSDIQWSNSNDNRFLARELTVRNVWKAVLSGGRFQCLMIAVLLNQNVLASNRMRQLEPFIEYFDHEWFRVFKHSSWSVNTNTWRTNNFAEGMNI